MLSKDLLKRIQSIQIRTGHMIDAALSGEYESVFKGRGMAFEEVREYFPGDDVRTIDWNVSARMDHPYVKVFREERELTIMLLIDISLSTHFGSQQKNKQEIIAEISAILAYIAIKNNDNVGVIFFSDKIEKFIPPKKGKAHVFRVIHDVLTRNPTHRGTAFKVPLEYLLKVQRKKAVCFLVSDFLSTEMTDGMIENNTKKLMQIIKKRHELSCIHVIDKLENNIPKIGLIEVEDAETKKRQVIDLSSERVRKWFFKKMREKNTNLSLEFFRLGVDLIKIETNKSTIEPLIHYLHKRTGRRKQNGHTRH